MHRLLYLAIITALLTACVGEDPYTTSASDKLTFETDTVAFDTVISGQPTHTYKFQVYNKASKAMRLQRVFLTLGASSPFKVNVDGTMLESGEASNIEIAAKDSISVFLFANLTDADSDTPIDVTDKLNFTAESGVTQSVVLMERGKSVITFSDFHGSKDTTLNAGRPYQIMDSIVVEKGKKLTLAPGTRLYFHPKAVMNVYGTLIAEGTINNPIMMRGDRLGDMFSHQSYDRIPGQWGGITFFSDSYDNKISFCDIHSGTFGISCDSSDTNRNKLTIENSVVHNMANDCLTLRQSRIHVGNCQISNAGGNCVSIFGGENFFVHCTLANFYVFTGGRGVALTYTNSENGVPRPLHQAEFVNCLITGYSKDEIMGIQDAEDESIPFNYFFRNCLLCTDSVDTEDIVECRWDNNKKPVCREKNFSPEFDLDKLVFHFGLAEESIARDGANASYSYKYYPADLAGRLRDDRPDIGCYEYIPKQNDE